MSKHNSLDMKPICLKDYSCKQSCHSHVPKVPVRMVLLAPSGSGKTVLLSNLILNIYRDCFERIYIFSPSIDIDATWEPVKKYQMEKMKVIEKEKEKTYRLQLEVLGQILFKFFKILFIKFKIIKSFNFIIKADAQREELFSSFSFASFSSFLQLFSDFYPTKEKIS